MNKSNLKGASTKKIETSKNVFPMSVVSFPKNIDFQADMESPKAIGRCTKEGTSKLGPTAPKKVSSSQVLSVSKVQKSGEMSLGNSRKGVESQKQVYNEEPLARSLVISESNQRNKETQVRNAQPVTQIQRNPIQVVTRPAETKVEEKKTEEKSPEKEINKDNGPKEVTEPYKIQKESTEYFIRQMLLEEIGKKGQTALSQTRVLVVGAGGIGSSCLLYLASSGVGTIGIVDGDKVEKSNLHRQIIHSIPRIGMNKVLLK